MNWRQKRKVFKWVAQRFERGDFSRLPRKYVDVIERTVDSCLIRSYDTVFRPKFYDNFGKWSTTEFVQNARETFDHGMREFEQLTGIKRDDWKKYFELNHTKGVKKVSEEIRRERAENPVAGVCSR